jgi:hypothetical protein
MLGRSNVRPSANLPNAVWSDGPVATEAATSDV